MLASAHEKDLRPRLLLFITRTEDEKRLEALLDEVHVPIFYQCRGKGTAPSEMLDIFGLSGSVRLITLGILPKFLVPNALKKIGRQLYFHQRGGGIVVTLPVTGLQTPVFQTLNEETRDQLAQQIKERIERDMAEMHEHSNYSMIWVSVANGYSDDVIDAAQAAGAKGGTILKGRRRNSEHVSQHLGISIQDEQDFVLIVVPREKKAAIMSAITTACGLRTPAHGVVFSLPVDEAVGLEE